MALCNPGSSGCASTDMDMAARMPRGNDTARKNLRCFTHISSNRDILGCVDRIEIDYILAMITS